jgi:hypothetical protein
MTIKYGKTGFFCDHIGIKNKANPSTISGQVFNTKSDKKIPDGWPGI